MLDASHNRLYSLQSFTEHPGLVHLEVSNNELESLAGIESLPQLTHLGAAHNRITDISSVSAATHLQRADLQRNELSDAAALEPLYGLAVLASLDLRANPATARPHYAETVLVNAAQCVRAALAARPRVPARTWSYLTRALLGSPRAGSAGSTASE